MYIYIYIYSMYTCGSLCQLWFTWCVELRTIMLLTPLFRFLCYFLVMTKWTCVLCCVQSTLLLFCLFNYIQYQRLYVYMYICTCTISLCDVVSGYFMLRVNFLSRDFWGFLYTVGNLGFWCTCTCTVVGACHKMCQKFASITLMCYIANYLNHCLLHF